MKTQGAKKAFNLTEPDGTGIGIVLWKSLQMRRIFICVLDGSVMLEQSRAI